VVEQAKSDQYLGPNSLSCRDNFHNDHNLKVKLEEDGPKAQDPYTQDAFSWALEAQIRTIRRGKDKSVESYTQESHKQARVVVEARKMGTTP